MAFSKHIERLIKFGIHNNMIEPLDIVLVRNELMALLNVDEPFEGSVDEENYESPIHILEDMLAIAIEKGMIENNVTEKDILDSKIMSKLMPRQSELNRIFNEIVRRDGLEAATDFFYKLSKDSNYIRMDRIKKNDYWVSLSEYGDLEITINLSKPEKDPKEIEKAKSMKSSNYPKCFLCLENVGYEGRFNHPARSNHRVLPITLNDESFYIQYSPYVYYNEHAIVFKEKHEPMAITKTTFKRLLDFTTRLPHYFLGSNADLPIVGGSILSHEHYQGGHHVFPMEKAKVIRKYQSNTFPSVTVGLLKWPLSVMRLSSKSKDDLIEYAGEILEAWRGYSDEEVGVLARSMYNGEDTPHNTITPIARINQVGDYELDLTLRNNRRSDEHPDGIYHPHKKYHHIKKENIGLIEVMGLAVLPARLKSELAMIKAFILSDDDIEKIPKELTLHKEWIVRLLESGIRDIEEEKLMEYLKNEVGNIFKSVLECSGVFKQTEEGLKHFEVFIKMVL